MANVVIISIFVKKLSHFLSHSYWHDMKKLCKLHEIEDSEIKDWVWAWGAHKCKENLSICPDWTGLGDCVYSWSLGTIQHL